MADGDLSLEITFPASGSFPGPVAVSGDVELVRGDDYAAADGRALEWANEDGTWPDLSDAAIRFGSTPIHGSELELDGDVVVPTGEQLVRVEVAAADTAALEPGTYRYDVQATLASDRTVTLARGRLSITEDEAP